MSGWDQWTDSLILYGAHHCGIHGHDGMPWSVKNMNIPPNEVKYLVQVISSQDQSIYANGIIINGDKWLPLRLEENLLVMKGKDENKDKTMTVCLTKQALIFGSNKDSSVQGGQVRKAVEDMKCNLENAGY